MEIQDVRKIVQMLGISRTEMPPVSDADRETGNSLWIFLCQQHPNSVPKAKLLAYLNWADTERNDRKLRLIIANLSFRKPVIATSDRCGYRISKGREDVTDVQHQTKETVSRIRELARKLPPLLDVLQAYGAEL